MAVETYLVKARELVDKDIKKTTIELPADLHHELRKITVIHNISMRELYIEAFYNYILPKYGTKGKF